VNPIIRISKLGLKHGGRPPAAVEITPEGVLAATLSAPDNRPKYSQFQPLTSGAIVPGISEPNVRAPEAVVSAIRDALGQVAPRSRAVTIVLPDAVVRVFILDFDSLPAKAADANVVLRFRLRKVVPFSLDDAALTFQVLKQDKEGCKVLAAVMPAPVLREYEDLVRKAGYEPGAVLSSSLAALEAIDSIGPMLIANMSQQTLTTVITHGNDLLLYRTMDLPQDLGSRLYEVQRGIAVAAAFFEDKLMCRPQYLHCAGAGGVEGFSSWLNALELTLVELASKPENTAVTALHFPGEPAPGEVDLTPVDNISSAGVAGALAGVR
jgi:type IV pilus assembly protein PilM